MYSNARVVVIPEDLRLETHRVGLRVILGYVHTYTFSKRSVFEKIRFGVSTRIVRQSGDPVHTDVD